MAKIFSHLQNPGRLWWPHSVLFNGYLGSIPGTELQGREVDHLYPAPRLRMSGTIPLLHYTFSWGLQGLPYHHHHPYALLHSGLAVLKTSRVSLTKHFLFTVLPKSDYTACNIQYCFLHSNLWARAEISSFNLACNVFGIIPIVDSTSGTSSTQAVSTFHILTSSFFFPQVFILLELLSYCAVKVVTVGNCYIY